MAQTNNRTTWKTKEKTGRPSSPEVPYQLMKVVSEGLFNSVLCYCLPLFGGCDISEVKSLQVLQNKAAQIVTRLPPRSVRNLMFDQLD